jgi:hypothetical protein
MFDYIQFEAVSIGEQAKKADKFNGVKTYAFTNEGTWSRKHHKRHKLSDLPQVCRQIYAETGTLAYAANIVDFYLWNRRLFDRCLEYIQSAKLDAVKLMICHVYCSGANSESCDASVKAIFRGLGWALVP